MPTKDGVKPNVLVAIDKLLKLKKITPQKIKGLTVALGPGNFSSLRVGITIANTFGWVLNKPVVGVAGEYEETNDFIVAGLAKLKKIKKFKPVAPEYGAEPNISQSKRV